MGGAIIVGSLIGGGLSYLGGQTQAEEVKKGSRRASKTQMAMLDKQLAALQAAVDAGEMDINTAYDEANRIIQESGLAEGDITNLARSYLMDPSQIFDLPGVEFQFGEGERALENILSKSTGGALSGAGVKAATRYGQDFASTQIDKALQRLFPFINLESTARGNLINLATGRGQSLSDLRMRGAGGQAGAIGQTGANVANIQNVAGQNLANIYGGQYSNIAELVSGGVENYALLSTLGYGQPVQPGKFSGGQISSGPAGDLVYY